MEQKTTVNHEDMQRFTVLNLLALIHSTVSQANGAGFNIPEELEADSGLLLNDLGVALRDVLVEKGVR